MASFYISELSDVNSKVNSKNSTYLLPWRWAGWVVCVNQKWGISEIKRQRKNKGSGVKPRCWLGECERVPWFLSLGIWVYRNVETLTSQGR